MSTADRPRFRVSADRQSASRRLRYVETSRPDDGSCTLCQLDEENPPALDETPAMSHNSAEDDAVFAENKLIEAIENQIAAGEPVAAQATLNKLTLVGYAREDAVRLMALILAHEIENMLAENRPFDGAGYEQMLRALPELPEALGDADDEEDE
ncbi:hypothetical protein SAMN05216229_10889 [Geopseudomonas sagittaria]|uniref:Uncharacterized protein n=1 Tax=Geopseudomonas sagittaria TaxID=1135990 RepID=A0A1I5UFT2_9GAMM|nr:hypothetical protein [Pseudomonas sagittaria]SFP94028.1 hypothetical protein SAMN05216229_10889 [Pseudomonas sagittaria]